MKKLILLIFSIISLNATETVNYYGDIVNIKLSQDSWNRLIFDSEINAEPIFSKEKNVDIVVNYLVKSWIAPKYIEEIIPTDNFWKVLEAMWNKSSPEYRFVNKLTISMINGLYALGGLCSSFFI